MAEADQLALNPSVAPGRILAGHPQHQGPDRLWGGWASWSSARVGPVAGDEVGVPTLLIRGHDSVLGTHTITIEGHCADGGVALVRGTIDRVPGLTGENAQKIVIVDAVAEPLPADVRGAAKRAT